MIPLFSYVVLHRATHCCGGWLCLWFCVRFCGCAVPCKSLLPSYPAQFCPCSSVSCQCWRVCSPIIHSCMHKFIEGLFTHAQTAPQSAAGPSLTKPDTTCSHLPACLCRKTHTAPIKAFCTLHSTGESHSVCTGV